MKRLHVHVAVDDLTQSIGFYSTLGADPSVVKNDYAKWMLDDPRVNFAISARGRAAGLDHLGIQAHEDGELAEISNRLNAAGADTVDEVATTCCYAQSDKTWVTDPSGIRWETFHSFGESTVYGADLDTETTGEACCAPTTPQGACCPPKSELAADAPCCGAASA